MEVGPSRFDAGEGTSYGLVCSVLEVRFKEYVEPVARQGYIYESTGLSRCLLNDSKPGL